MSHYEKIPQLLESLITCSAAEACRRAGITPQTWWNYVVRSKLGEERFQKIEFCTVVAPLHIHYANAKTLAAQQIEQNAIERARDGCLVDVFFQGVRQFEKVLKPQYADCDADDLEIIFGEDTSNAYEMKPTKQWLKPSDALTIKMLEAHNPKYQPHQNISVGYSGVLRLERPEEQSKTIEATPQVFEDAVVTDEQKPPQLALTRPAKDSAEMNKWEAAGEFKPAPVVFQNAKGDRTELKAELRGLVDEPAVHNPRAYLAPTLQKPAPVPSYGPPGRVGDAVERTGLGPDPSRVAGHQGFRVSGDTPKSYRERAAGTTQLTSSGIRKL
jgi:hypothetical protein